MLSLSTRRKKMWKTAWFPNVVLAGIVTLLGSCSLAEKSLDGRSKASNALAPVQMHQTSAGHSYWYIPMPDSDRTAVAVTWHSDLPNVAAGREATPRVGISLMLNGGAGGLPAEEIIADFQDLDSGSDLWVNPQEISGFIVAPREHMDKASEIANLVLTQPNFEQRWFEREKNNLVDDATERKSSVAGQAWNFYRAVTIGDHPYSNYWSLAPINGVESIELDDVKNWHTNAFSTANMTITVAGNADVKSVSAAIDRVLRDMPNTQPAAMRDFPAPVVPAKTILLHRPAVEKSMILTIGNMPDHARDLDIPLQLGIGVLGYGKQSRLFKTVRSGLRASYGFGANILDMTRQHRILFMAGEVETAKLQVALNETRTTYEKFREKGISLVEFPIAKRFYLNRIRDEIVQPPSVAYMLMETRLNDFEPSFVRTLSEEITAQKRSDVNQVIKESLPEFDSLLKIIVTPDANAIEGACVITEFEQWKDCA